MFSVCMIVKNEEKFLDNCLASLHGCTDDLIVVDTGSDDGTKEIIKKHGVRLFEFTWTNDFSAARNFAAEQAKYDWVMSIDADEELVEIDLDELRLFMENPRQVGKIRMYEVCETPCYTYETRFYNRLTCSYKNKIHEQFKFTHGGGEPKISDIHIYMNHYGYAKDVMQSRNKLLRNENMLLEEIKTSPSDPFLYYQLGKTYAVSWSSEPKKACASFEKALALNPDLSLSYVQSLVIHYGYALINSGEYEKALCVEQYLPAYQNNPFFRFMLAHVYLNNGLLIESVDKFESCIGDPTADFVGVTSYLSYYNIGVVFECAGMLDDAADYYRQCGEYAPARNRLKEIADA